MLHIWEKNTLQNVSTSEPRIPIVLKFHKVPLGFICPTKGEKGVAPFFGDSKKMPPGFRKIWKKSATHVLSRCLE